VIAVARYLLAAQLRDRTLVAPAVVLSVGVVYLYSLAPNPVLATAGSVAAWLFFAQAWLALAFFNGQSAADRQVVIATVGARGFACGRLLAGAVLALTSALVAVAYPLIAGRFAHAPSLGELVLCVLASLVATLGGTTLGALFAPPLVRSRAVAALGLALCALLTVPLGPPAVSTARAMNTTHSAAVPARLAGDVGSTVLFAIAVVFVCTALWRRTE
jgi:hypothetical protein